MNYRREIDGLRAVAVVPVILFHAGFAQFGGGFVGVDVFFVVSGYLITSIILTDVERGEFSLLRFYERRMRRILPALFFVVFACMPFALFWLLPGEMREFSRSVVAVAIFLSNVFFWRQSGYFDTAAELKPLLHTWSLAVEEQFYVLFPLCLMLAFRFGRRRAAALAAIAMLASLAVAHWGAFNRPAASFFLLHSRAWELLLGALLAGYLAKCPQPSWPRSVEQFASACGLALILYAVFTYDKSTPFPGLYALPPTVGTGLIIVFANPRTAVGQMLGWGPCVLIGLISYSAYLWHQPLLAFARHAHAAEPEVWLLLSLCAAALALGYLSWRYIERPFRRPGVVGRRAVFGAAIAASFGLIAFGLAGHFSKGFAFRYDAADRALATIDSVEMGHYIDRRFNGLNLKDFDPADRRKKIVVIGDSYGKDIVNAIYESGLDRRVQVSTYFIRAGCGNLHMTEGFTAKLAAADVPSCAKAGWYRNEKLQRLMREADSVWLVSSWRLWQAGLLPQSVANIERDFTKHVLVFGRKNFGSYTIGELLRIPQARRADTEKRFDDFHVSINGTMKRALPQNRFVDLSELLCGNAAQCRLFTAAGELISHDGRHLTAPGARYVGARLIEHPLLRDLLRD